MRSESSCIESSDAVAIWIASQSSKACCSSRHHANGEDGFSRERKGNITDAMEKA